ncbi:MAG TPA: hypothetical protein VL133_10810 [Devosia sp.]|nr:hypothetical protein [Devosia sp.]
MGTRWIKTAVIIGLGAALSAPVLAQEATPQQDLLFQLNNAETVDTSCQVTFVVQNNTGVAIANSAYSMSVVDSTGRVRMLITFEFGAFPMGRPKVQQFALADLACADISAISINEFVSCSDAAGAPLPVCESALKASSLVAGIQFPWSL